jgi:thioredoxin 1
VKRILLAGLCFAAFVSAGADVIEFQNGARTECQVLSLFNQRLEYADKDGSVAHVDFPQIKRIDFDSKTAMLTTRGRVILNGELHGLEDGMFTLTTAHGGKQLIAASEVTDFTVSSEREAPPPPPPYHPKPSALEESNSRSAEKGSIEPERGKITIVDFYADWCGPCRRIGPILEKIAEGNSDIVLQKVNIDRQRDLAKEYHVTAIPHIIIFDKLGKEAGTVIGSNEPRVRQVIKQASNS